MDAELALLTANMALAAPGKLIYDPFVGTGGFPLACAAFGATGVGSDMDGRVIRGEGGEGRVEKGSRNPPKPVMNEARTNRSCENGQVEKNGDTSVLANGKDKGKKDIRTNFACHNLQSRYLDSFISDLTNTPVRAHRFLDAIVCDQPYGIREGLKVLGSKREDKGKEVVWIDGVAAHLYVDNSLPLCITPSHTSPFVSLFPRSAMLKKVL